MNRREYLRLCGTVSTAGMAAIAGCNTAEAAPPPRKSNVVEDVRVSPEVLVVDLPDDGDEWVVSRRDIDTRQSVGAIGVPDAVASDASSTAASDASGSAGLGGSLSPVGVASAAKGRGATGRGRGGFSDAPRTRKGRAWFWGGSYANSWYDDHDDETERYPVDIATLGVAYLGTNARFQQRDPGPGPVDWDETYQEPSGEVRTELANRVKGWYRVGARLVVDEDALAGDDNRDLGWDSVDVRVEQSTDGPSITERWKVSPRI